MPERNNIAARPRKPEHYTGDQYIDYYFKGKHVGVSLHEKQDNYFHVSGTLRDFIEDKNLFPKQC